jgi:peptidoglycan/LPS O-acetylase OafA/YrhL
MPGKLFWTYFVGVALIAAALSFIFRVRIRLAATLLGIMFFCFVAMMDLPGAIAAPQSRFAWTLAARELAFGAGAMLLAVTSGARERTAGENRVAIGALYLIALISMFYGIEHFLHPECVPVVPLAKTTPLWIPFAHFWTVLTGIILVIGGGSDVCEKRFTTGGGRTRGVGRPAGSNPLPRHHDF